MAYIYANGLANFCLEIDMAYHIDKKRCHGIKAKIVHDTNRPYECVFPSSESRRMQERILGMDVVEIRVAEGYGELIVGKAAR
jgi:hypothetical protein